MSQFNNSAKIYTNSPKGEYTLSISNTKQAIALTNNKARHYSELAEKYKNEAKEFRDTAQYYAEQNSDVTYEYTNNVKNELLSLIQTKQDSGNYAVKEELPTKVSELYNDSHFTTFEEVIPLQQGNEQKVLCTDGKNLYWETNNSYNLFDIKYADHVLDIEESLGWALQGTWVYKEAVAGSRYGYPDFYNKVVEEYNQATSTETVNSVTVKVHSNGHKFYDITKKNAIDNFYDTMGSAWFYGVDIANERIFLPRNKYFAIDGVADNVAVVGNGTTLGMTNAGGNFGLDKLINNSSILGNPNAYGVAVGSAVTDAGISSKTTIGLTTDATKSGIIAKTIDVLKLDKNKYLYICVGNTTNYEGVTDVVNQGMEILEQVAQKVNIDATNLNSEGKSLIAGYAMPSSRYIDLTFGASGTTYTAPANGYFTAYVQLSNSNAAYIGVYNQSKHPIGNVLVGTAAGNSYKRIYVPVMKGDICAVTYANTTTGDKLLRFYYAEGDK